MKKEMNSNINCSMIVEDEALSVVVHCQTAEVE